MKISSIGEFGLIDRIAGGRRNNDKNVIVGIGDDAAVIKLSTSTKQKFLLLTTDTLVENVHFSLKYFTFFEIGWKLMAANLSDIAAMGGRPGNALVTLGLTKNISAKNIDDLYTGMRALGKRYGVAIIGGDFVRSPKYSFFTMALYGMAEKPVLRSGARPGDKIVVLGKVGASAYGLEQLKRYGRKGRNVKAHLMPEPMLEVSDIAAKVASSMIDNSDGLARCLIEICRASGVGARVISADIPLAKGASLKQGLDGGEDYNLVLTVPKSRSIKGARVIGEITKGRKILLIDGHGKASPLNDKGFEHF